jgi:hypothetical protein
MINFSKLAFNNCSNRIIGLTVGARKNIVQWDCSNWCLVLFSKVALVNYCLHVACKQHANCKEI